jgi:1-acyl-sn-glycerol-3-phosphate acyltransferase
MIVVALDERARLCGGHVVEWDSVIEEWEVGHCRWCGAVAYPDEIREPVMRAIERLCGAAFIDRSRSN